MAERMLKIIDDLDQVRIVKESELADYPHAMVLSEVQAVPTRFAKNPAFLRSVGVISRKRFAEIMNTPGRIHRAR